MRFSIRDLLWLTLLAAVAAAWWVDHRRLDDLLQKLPPRVTAEGLVTFQGQPLGNAFVTVLYPDGNSAVAITNGAGKFTLVAFFGRGGAPPGKGLVVLLRTAAPNNLLPAKYASPATSSLRIDLPSSGSKGIVIEMP